MFKIQQENNSFYININFKLLCNMKTDYILAILFTLLKHVSISVPGYKWNKKMKD